MQAPPPQDVLNSLPAEVVILDREGRILSGNRAWQSFGQSNGASHSGWVGVNYLEASRGPDGGDEARAAIQQMLEGKRRRFEQEYPCHSPTQQRWFEMVATRLDGEGGPWIVLSHTDITARHEVEKMRRQRWQDAQEVRAAQHRAKFIRDLANELAHELRTPLTTLSLRLHALEPAIPPAQAAALRGSLDRLVQATGRIAAIVHALDKVPNPVVFPAQSLAKAMEDLAPEAVRRGLRLAVHLPDAQVRVDAELAQQCLAALVASCAATCPAGGALQLAGQVKGHALEMKLTSDTRGPMGGSDADLWLTSARELARQAGLLLHESQGQAVGEPLHFGLRGPLGRRAGVGGSQRMRGCPPQANGAPAPGAGGWPFGPPSLLSGTCRWAPCAI